MTAFGLNAYRSSSRAILLENPQRLTCLIEATMSDSAWTLLMIVLAPVVFINLILFGLLVRAAFQLSQEKQHEV